MKNHRHSQFLLVNLLTGAFTFACSSGEVVDSGTGGTPATESGGAPSGSGGSLPVGMGGSPNNTGGAQTETGGAGSGGDEATGGNPDDGAGGAEASGGGENANTGGMPGTGGADNGAPTASDGCNKPLGTLRTGEHNIQSSNTNREFTIDIPTNYDPSKPYRLFFTWHWVGSTDNAVADGVVPNGGPHWAYYGLKRQANEAGEPAIFIAPQSRHGRWDAQDHVLFDDLLKLAKDNLCIDESRVFATGFSFGGMQTYSLSLNHQKDLRAVVALSPANFNIHLPENTHERIAYMSTTGMSDTTTPWDEGGGLGARYAALEHARDNGCTIPANIPTVAQGSNIHFCYDFEGCDEGYPVKVCTFNGAHWAAPADGTNGENGRTTWIPPVSWEFFSQF